MCPPEYFGVMYEINPWMHREVVADIDRAQEEWENLAATLRVAGAVVEVLPPEEGWPDLVFTANAGLIFGDTFFSAQFRHEVAGDALPFADGLVAAYRFRSDAASHAYLSRLTGAAVRSIELVDERLYHLDLTFCPLDDRRAMVAPLGWDRYGAKVMEALVPEPLVLEAEETVALSANSVVVGTTVVMPHCPRRVGAQLERWGFDVVVAPVSEFLKAGGGCRCLTLALDVRLGALA